MARFFIAASNIFGGIAYLDKESADHVKVLRIRKGEKFTVCDGAGTDYVCQLTDTENGDMGAEILEKLPSPGEPNTKCAIYAAFSKGDKLETVIQKGVELGASEFVLFPSKRCVVKYEGASLIKKIDRWQKIAKEAAKQSGRGIIPTVRVVGSYAEAVKQAAEAELSLFCYEEEKALSLKVALEEKLSAGTISVFTGPEGGFEPSEAALAVQSGMQSVTLGTRILRCETAPLAALSAIMLFTGNM